MTSDEFRIETCTITGEECYFSNCDLCAVQHEAREEAETRQIEYILNFNHNIKLYGETVTLNIPVTMGVADMPTYKRMVLGGLVGTRYAWGNYVKTQYPHFILLMKRMDINPPNEVIKCKYNLGVFVCDDCVYMCAEYRGRGEEV